MIDKQARPLPPAVCVIGLGLIGGSIVRGLAERAPDLPVSGWSPTDETRAAAQADGVAVHKTVEAALATAAAGDALVVLATPLTHFTVLLRMIGELAPTVAVTDVGSVKAQITRQAADIAPRARFVGSHPMAGTQFSGWAAGSPTLFEDASWVTTVTESTDLDTWSRVAGLALTLGSRVVPTDADAHDAAVARVSHLPHVLALALAEAGRQGGSLALSLAASSFADGTRVAATRPELIRAMCETNLGPLVEALDDALALLGVARASLASTGSLHKLTDIGHRARLEFERRGADLEPVDLAGEDMIEQLLAVGAAGGFVSEVSGTGTDLRVRAHYPAD